MTEIRKDDRLSGRVAIVTGAGSCAEGIGNGRAASILLARHGAKVLLIDALLEPSPSRRAPSVQLTPYMRKGL